MGDRRFVHQKNVDDALKVLKNVVDTLDKHHIKYYLDFGTLLGVIRHAGFIPWDDDIDISLVNQSDYAKMAKVFDEIKTQYGYRVYPITFLESRNTRKRKGQTVFNESVSYAEDDEMQITKIRNNKFWKFGRGNVNMDIFFKYEVDNELYWLAEGKTNKIDASFLKEGLKQIDFYGISCTIPVAHDTYLTNAYGDWKIPQEQWVEADGLTQER